MSGIAISVIEASRVTDLESAGLLDRRPDPHDRRRALVSLSEAGVEALLASRREREGWLAGEIEKLSAADRRTLARAVELLDGIAGSR
ncbi:MAG: hypothetical protein AB7V58_11485 [Solirubrobacterales bacterium]